jgi:hypothetical protein
VQVILAWVRMLVPGMVSTLPARVPKAVDGLPDAAKFVSVQLAAWMVKFVAAVSVIATAVPLVVADIGARIVG